MNETILQRTVRLAQAYLGLTWPCRTTDDPNPDVRQHVTALVWTSEPSGYRDATDLLDALLCGEIQRTWTARVEARVVVSYEDDENNEDDEESYVNIQELVAHGDTRDVAIANLHALLRRRLGPVAVALNLDADDSVERFVRNLEDATVWCERHGRPDDARRLLDIAYKTRPDR